MQLVVRNRRYSKCTRAQDRRVTHGIQNYESCLGISASIARRRWILAAGANSGDERRSWERNPRREEEGRRRAKGNVYRTRGWENACLGKARTYRGTANYAVNLRVCTRTRNNAGNLERLHGSRGNVQRGASDPRACVGKMHARRRGRVRGFRGRRIMWRSAWFMRAVRAKNAETSVVYIGRRRKRSSNQWYNEGKRNEREIVHTYVRGRTKRRTGEEHLRVCAPVPRS